MDFFLFNLFSTFENTAAIFLLLAIFKYRVTDYSAHILLTSLVLSLISHTLHVELNNSNLVPIVSLITLFLFIWIAFRVAIFYALIISVVGYVVYGLLQAIVLFILQSLGFASTEMVEKAYSSQAYELQIITSIIALAIAYLLRQKNYGFNWIPYSKSAKFNLEGDNLLLFMVVLLAVIVIGLIFYLFLSGYLHLLAIFFLIFMVLILLFYFAGKEERKYYD